MSTFGRKNPVQRIAAKGKSFGRLAKSIELCISMCTFEDEDQDGSPLKNSASK
jgi:hypothetical protein